MTDRTSHTRRSLTLEEIGALAGASRSTVSRVLNGHPHVRTEVRRRVEAVIAETGYLPNQAARALVSNRTGLVGLVMPTDADDLFGDPYYSALVHGIQEGCIESGSTFSIFPIHDPDGETTALSTLVAQGFVDGVIATAGAGSERLISVLRDRGKNLVVVGHPADSDGLRRVDVENRKGSAAATQHLLDAGRRRIGFVGPTSEHIYGVERLDGYTDALRSAERAVDERLVRHAPPTVDGGYDATASLIDQRPDAIHVATDTMAVGALGAIAAAGMSVPTDVAIVGFDGFPNASPIELALTTVVQPVGEVGRAAVRLLDSDVRDPDVVMLPTSLRIGDSCGTRPG